MKGVYTGISTSIDVSASGARSPAAGQSDGLACPELQ